MDNILHQLERRLVNSTQSVDLSGGWFWNSEKKRKFQLQANATWCCEGQKIPRNHVCVCDLRALLCWDVKALRKTLSKPVSFRGSNDSCNGESVRGAVNLLMVIQGTYHDTYFQELTWSNPCKMLRYAKSMDSWIIFKVTPLETNTSIFP